VIITNVPKINNYQGFGIMKNKLSLFVNICFVVFFIAGMSANSAIAVGETDWMVGESIVFGVRETLQSSTEWVNETLEGTTTIAAESEIKMTIQTIDAENKEAETKFQYSLGLVMDITLNYDAIENGQEYAEDIFSFNYYWDYNFNRHILTSFSINLYGIIPFLEPDWVNFNKYFVESVNQSRIITSINTGYEIVDIEFNDFLESITSYEIMGESNISDAQEAFKSTTTKWSFEFDLTDYILDTNYDFEDQTWEYFSYDKYVLSATLEYSNGGTLEKGTFSKESIITLDNITTTNVHNFAIVRGGLAALETDFSFVAIVAGLAILQVTVIVLKRRKRT
jgi:hypothetical protein